MRPSFLWLSSGAGGSSRSLGDFHFRLVFSGRRFFDDFHVDWRFPALLGLLSTLVLELLLELTIELDKASDFIHVEGERAERNRNR